MLLDSQSQNSDSFAGILSDASSTTVAQLLLDARQAIGSDVGAALRCIRQAASLLGRPPNRRPSAPRGAASHAGRRSGSSATLIQIWMRRSKYRISRVSLA